MKLSAKITKPTNEEQTMLRQNTVDEFLNDTRETKESIAL